MYKFDPYKKPKKLSLFLAKPNRGIIGKIKDAYELKQNLKQGNINELSFSIPLYTYLNHQTVKHPSAQIIKERYLIKVVLDDEEEWYIITKIGKESQDTDRITISCYSLPYELKYKKIRNYTATSYNCIQVLEDCLKETNWTVGYINPDFNLTYRQFDNTGTRLDFLFTICTTFKAVPVFDTVNRTVSLYKKEETEIDDYLRITHKKYIQSLQQTIDIDSVCTRLHMYGANDSSIQGVVPTGQDYVDDFSYFLYPFQRDDDKNVISHSDYMSDELCHAILDYNELIVRKFDEFNDLLTQKKNAQEELTTLQNDLTALQSDLTIILDNIEVAKETGVNLGNLYTQRDIKQAYIRTKNKQIESTQQTINSISDSITNIGNETKLENNFSPTLLSELNDYVMHDDFSDNNITNDTDLYNAGMEHFKTINTPPINISMSIVDFRQIVKEQYNWDKLVLGGIVRIWHERLNIEIKTVINEISIDYDAGTISLNITNDKQIDSDENKFLEHFYNLQKTAKDASMKVTNLQTVAQNFNLRNDRISTKPSSPTLTTGGALKHVVNDNGTVNLQFIWSFPDKTDDAYNIDGFIIHFYSSSLSDTYIFGSSRETLVSVEKSTRSYVFPSIPANLYYTIGIQSYRTVDTDIELDGVLVSDIVSTDEPYQPLPTVNIKGRLNNVTYTTSGTAPSNPEVNDIWNDTNENKTKIYTASGWQVTSSGNSDKVGGYTASVSSAPNTVVVRDANGGINGSISGDASTLGGKTSNDFILVSQKGVANGVATLDSTGNVPLNQLNNVPPPPAVPVIKIGTYTGDGVSSKSIDIGFAPSLVRVYTVKNDDMSTYINSTTGGFLMKNNVSTFYLEGVGTNLDTASDTYGKLSSTGFVTGSTTDTYINKLNVKYMYEAIKIP